MSTQTQLRFTQLLLALCLGSNIWLFTQISRTREEVDQKLQSTKTGTFENLRVTRPGGELLMEFCDEEGPVIRLYNNQSVPVVRLDTGSLSFAHSATKVAAIGKTDSGGYVKLSDENGHTALELLPDQAGLGTAFFWQNNQLRTKIPEPK